MTKILSLNIRIWTRDTKRQSEHWWVARYRAIHEYIKEQDPDVICLQEVWWPAKYVLRLGKLGYKKTGWGFSHPIYVRKRAKVSERAVSIFSTMAIVDEVQYFSVHAHWEEKKFSKAMAWIREHKWNREFVAAGDFNKSATSVRDGLYPCLADSVRVLLGLKAEDTFVNYKRPTESHGEIDHFFCSYGSMYFKQIKSYEVGTGNLSDHRPIVLTFNVK